MLTIKLIDAERPGYMEVLDAAGQVVANMSLETDTDMEVA